MSCRYTPRSQEMRKTWETEWSVIEKQRKKEQQSDNSKHVTESRIAWYVIQIATKKTHGVHRTDVCLLPDASGHVCERMIKCNIFWV